MIELPQILYKYRADNEYTEKIFKNKKIWMAKPGDLNDPMEGRIAEVQQETRRRIRTQTMQHQLAGFIMLCSHHIKSKIPLWGMDKYQIKKFLKKFKKLKTLELKHKLVNSLLQSNGIAQLSDPESLVNSIENVVNNAGIFSMSEINNSTLMWSHYGDQHKGLCIGFKVESSSKLADSKICKPVNYKNEIPEMNFDAAKSELSFSLSPQGQIVSNHSLAYKDPSIINALFTKSEDWGYEKEWRYVSEKSGEYDLPAQIVEIIFGLNFPSKRLDFYINLVLEAGFNEISFKKIINEKNSFGLKIVEL